MADAGFVNDLDGAAECQIVAFNHGGIFSDRNNQVVIADHMEQRNAGGRQRSQIVDGVSAVGERLLFGQTISGQTFRPPVGIGLLTEPGSARPAFKIAGWCVGIDAVNLFRILCRPVVDDQPTARHALKNRFGVEAVRLREQIVKCIEARNRNRRSVKSGHVDVGNVIAVAQQRDIRIGFVIPEAGAPDPRRAGGNRVGNDNFAVQPVGREGIQIEAVEIR